LNPVLATESPEHTEHFGGIAGKLLMMSSFFSGELLTLYTLRNYEYGTPKIRAYLLCLELFMISMAK
jgi:hypothetical protein